MFRPILTLSNNIRRRTLISTAPLTQIFGNNQFFDQNNFFPISSFNNTDNVRFYCRPREPRMYWGKPGQHRRIELPNPVFTDRKPKSLDSLNYFDEKDSENQENEKDILYSSIEIEYRGHDTAVLKSYETFALSAAKHLEITVSLIFVPPEPYIRWMRTLLRSVHIFKRRRFQYETRTYYRRFTIARVTGSTADTFLEYIQRNLPEGVGMRVMRRQFIDRPDFLKQIPKGAREKEQERTKEDNLIA